MIAISLFFQWFGFFAFIGAIVLFVMINKELKKQLPTEEEKQELIAQNLISANEKNKKVLRDKTLTLRAQKRLMQAVNEELQKRLEKTIVEADNDIKQS